jgi:ribosomal-protein-alanine N-acetyltransferase
MENNPATLPGHGLIPGLTQLVNSDWKIRFRQMTLEDIPQVHAIDTLSFNMPWPVKSYLFELTQNKNSILWVAEGLPQQEGQEHRVIGMIVVWFIVDEAHVATLAIQPEFRGRGLSKVLLALGLREAIQRGAIETTLEVRASNWVALRLYEKFNYQITGRRPRYYHDNNEDAIIMTAKGLGTAYLNWLETMLTDT